MTRRFSGTDLHERWHLGRALVEGEGTSRTENAAGRWVDRGGQVIAQQDFLLSALAYRIGDRGGREQRLRVRMRRPREDLLPGALLHELAEVHDGDLVGQVFHRGQ